MIPFNYFSLVNALSICLLRYLKIYHLYVRVSVKYFINDSKLFDFIDYRFILEVSMEIHVRTMLRNTFEIIKFC